MSAEGFDFLSTYGIIENAMSYKSIIFDFQSDEAVPSIRSINFNR